MGVVRALTPLTTYHLKTLDSRDDIKRLKAPAVAVESFHDVFYMEDMCEDTGNASVIDTQLNAIEKLRISQIFHSESPRVAEVRSCQHAFFAVM